MRREVKNRTGTFGRAVDHVGNFLANPWLFFCLLLLHVLWVVANLGVLEFLPVWDPYPFTCLATIASALAPFVSLLILMRQHRDARIAELREELALQVSLEIERKTTLLMRALDDLRQGLDVPARMDSETLDSARTMLHPDKLLEDIRGELDDAEGERMTS